MIKKLALSVLFLILLQSGPISGFTIEGVENLGMGGAGTAVDSPKAPIYNPALLGLREKFSLTIFDLPLTVSHDLTKAGLFIYKNMDKFSQFSDLTQTEQDEILELAEYDMRIDLSAVNPSFYSGPYPLHTGARWWDMWWGMGFYNEVKVNPKLNVSQSLLVPTFDLSATADGIVHLPLVFGVTYLPYGLPGDFYASVAPKYLFRTKVEEKRRSLADIENFTEELQNKNYKPGTGYGFDLGFYYRISDKFQLGSTLKNLPGITMSFPEDEDQKIPVILNTGFTYLPFQKITLTADLRDIKIEDFSQANFFTKLHLGAKINLTRLLCLRTGLYQGYPTAGFGIGNFFNYAFYGQELGNYPGDNPIWKHTVALAIKI